MTTALQLMTSSYHRESSSTSRFRLIPSYCAKVLSTAQWRRCTRRNNSGMPRLYQQVGLISEPKARLSKLQSQPRTEFEHSPT